MKLLLTASSIILLAGCTATLSITPYHPPLVDVETDVCERTVLSLPPPIPHVPKLSAAAKSDTDKAYLEMVQHYRDLRVYTKSLVQQVTDYVEQPGCH